MAYSDLEFKAETEAHERTTLLSLAHFLRVLMMYSTWECPELLSRDTTSFSVSLPCKTGYAGERDKIKNETSFKILLFRHQIISTAEDVVLLESMFLRAF